MTTAHRYPKSCDKAASPIQDAEMIYSYAEGNQGQGDQLSTLGDDQGGQLPGKHLDTSLPAVPHGYLVPDPSLNVSQSTSLHLPWHNSPPSHPHHLYNIVNNNCEDTFVTYDDGEAHPAFPIHGLQAPPPGHVPLAHALYSQALSTYGLQALPPDHFTHAPSLALGSAAAVVTENLSALSLASPPSPILKAPISNLGAIDVTKRVSWHVRNAVTIGTIWLCPFVGCPHWLVRSKDAFKTHLQRRHYKTSGRLCPVQGCNIKIGYHVDLKRHIDQVHLGIGHYCSCDGKWYPRLETLKKQCSRKDKCPGAVDHRVTGVSKKGGPALPSKH
ncbi:hypothetical protein BG006_000801 [Podila minutissima]|uniref:C2H2-type domain-containing protein n=1 Tax=Podila minutissima TaxID=64525 RepID=A0A9P5VPB4_9FUNG|nr:hypothetical protein BG006_000801 [Podila minutissima]